MASVTPRVDIAFKKIFGVEENKDLLISLINSIVSEEDRAVEVELLNPYNPRNFKKDKLSILDVKAKNQAGIHYDIEIQITDEADYDKRALYYWAKLYSEQLGKSVSYNILNKAIGIHILNFTSIPETEKYHNVFKMHEVETKLHFFKDIELHTIELSKFVGTLPKSKQPLSKAEELELLLPKIKNALDMWTTFLARDDLLEVGKLPKVLNAPELQKALSIIEEMNFTKAEREAYEEHLKWLRVEANTLRKVEDTAYERGHQEGIERGIEKGKAERNIEIAKSLLSSGIDIKIVSSTTGISMLELEKFKRSGYNTIS